MLEYNIIENKRINLNRSDMKKLALVIVCMASLFSGCSPKQDKIAVEWEKIHNSKSQSFKNFNDAKFGMFIHFGAYSHLGGFWKGEKVKGIGECSIALTRRFYSGDGSEIQGIVH
jgi:hypothetical protein